MRRVLYAIGVLIVVLIGSIIVGPFLIPTDKIKNEVTQQASESLGRDVTGSLVNVYSMRMAAVFTLTTVTIARRTQIVAR